MAEIKRVPYEISGVKDGVQLDLKAVHTTYFNKKMGQQVLNCSVVASWESGVMTMTYKVGSKRQSISIRLDEALALLAAASDARKEAEPDGQP